MPSKRHTDATITIRLGYDLLPHISVETLSRIVSEESNEYIIGNEYADLANKDTQHFHIGCRLKKADTISDNFKKRFIRKFQDNFPVELTADNLIHGFKILSHNDFNLLVGYCTKQDLKPHYVGMTTSYVDSCREYYYANQKQVQQKLPVGRTAYLKLMRDAYDELWSKLAVDMDKCDKFEKCNASRKLFLLESILIGRGYDLTCIAPSQKRELVTHFDTYIVRSAEGNTNIDSVLDLL